MTETSKTPLYDAMIRACCDADASPINAADDLSKYAGRRIVAAEIANDRLMIAFDDGVTIGIWDDCQQCCEARYMTTDDDVSSIIGHDLIHIVAKDGHDVYDEYETVFVEVQTSGGFITITNHNEHNGYYGGFHIAFTEARIGGK